jgi:hypothetical protein
VTATVTEAVAQRVAGGRPSRSRALFAAAVAAAGAGVLTYRLLRSTNGSSTTTDDEGDSDAG